MRYAYQAYGVIQHYPVGRIRRSLNCTPNVGHNLTSEGAVYETFI